ncbi:MAG: hypothetical protein CDV28_1556 [Candidatus Electronema aureum]|uniref:Uncharacterized protein n=1 Tax=Candidatus Electronema aureum TaxID=2005002 RepID=A0A521FYK6_9BACT|nr:MAG: hypothetical protein CDV28_1556 [Candidatus Electronema aureum]
MSYGGDGQKSGFPLLDLIEDSDAQFELRHFFTPDRFVKIAFVAIAKFFDIITLYLTFTEGTSYNPAATTAVHAAVNAVSSLHLGHRTNPQLGNSLASGFPSAFFEFPAVQLFLVVHIRHLGQRMGKQAYFQGCYLKRNFGKDQDLAGCSLE